MKIRTAAMIAEATLIPTRARKQRNIAPLSIVASYTAKKSERENCMCMVHTYTAEHCQQLLFLDLPLSKAMNFHSSRYLTQISMIKAMVPVDTPITPTNSQRIICVCL